MLIFKVLNRQTNKRSNEDPINVFVKNDLLIAHNNAQPNIHLLRNVIFLNNTYRFGTEMCVSYTQINIKANKDYQYKKRRQTNQRIINPQTNKSL